MKTILLSTITAVTFFGAAYAASAQTRERVIIVDPAVQPEGPAYYENRYYRAPNSVLPGTENLGPCGLPDRGAPNSALNLNNRCDNEEFMRRSQELGPGR